MKLTKNKKVSNLENKTLKKNMEKRNNKQKLKKIKYSKKNLLRK